MKLLYLASVVVCVVFSVSVLAQGDLEDSLEHTMISWVDEIQILTENSEQWNIQDSLTDQKNEEISDQEDEALLDQESEITQPQMVSQEWQTNLFEHTLVEDGEDDSSFQDESDDITEVLSWDKSSDQIVEEVNESISDDFSLQDDEIVISQDYNLLQNNANTISWTPSTLLSDTEQRTIFVQSQTITIVRK